MAGTVFIVAGTFWLSFTSPADFARRFGVGAEQASMWSLIVECVSMVSTVAALATERPPWYPCTLLVDDTAESVTANSLHAAVAADTDVPGPLLHSRRHKLSNQSPPRHRTR